MPPLRLSAVSRTHGNNAALKDGTVTPPGVELAFEEVPVLVHAFRRMVRELEFDVCEMALTTYLCARAHGVDFTALPIFLVRDFHHGAIVVGEHSDLRGPKDLEGRRVGVNRGYTVTTGVWARAILRDEHDVDLDAVRWERTGDEHVAAYQPPPNVTQLSSDTDLPGAIANGTLAAAVGLRPAEPHLVPLIVDHEQAGLRALRERGHYPINHVVVVRDEVLAEHPWVAHALFEAFAEAKRRYVAWLCTASAAELASSDRTYRAVLDATGEDPLPYGIEPNRRAIEELLHHTVDQAILAHAPSVAGLFHPSTHDLVA